MPGYRPNTYALPESVQADDYVVAKYQVIAETRDYLRLAGEIAAQQSTGSWVRLPMETDELMARHGAKVIGAFEVPAYEYVVPAGKRTMVLEIAFPHLNFDTDIPMLLTTVMGEVSMMGTVKLLDVTLPKAFVDGLPGPKFGVPGMRQYLGVPKRPLVLNVIKPPTGLTPEETAALFYEVAVGGVDIVNDDGLIADNHYSSVSARARACMAAERRAYEETGERTYYAVNITARPNRLLENARAAMDAGANMLMVSPLTAGYGSLQMLAESPEFEVPLFSHPDFAGPVSWQESSGVSVHLSLGKLVRLCGGDVSAYLTPYSKKLALGGESCFRTLIALQAPLCGKRPAWPLQAGGVTPGMVPVIVGDMGLDIVVGAGAGIHAHPMGPRAGAMAHRQALDAVLEGRSIREAAEAHPELCVALEAWGAPDGG